MVLVISEDLKFNFFKLLEMRDISAEEKGAFVRSIMQEENLTQRGFAKKYNYSHSTVHDWVSGRQMRKYYDNKINEELSKFHVSSFRKEAGFNGVDTLIDRLLFVLTKKEYKATSKTNRLLRDLKFELERLEL